MLAVDKLCFMIKKTYIVFFKIRNELYLWFEKIFVLL